MDAATQSSAQPEPYRRSLRHDNPEPRRGALALIGQLQREFTDELSFHLVRMEEYAVIGEIRHRSGGRIGVKLTPHSGYWLGQVDSDGAPWHIRDTLQQRVHSAVDRHHRSD